MSTTSLMRRSWVKAAVAIVLVMVVLSPAFAWAAGQIGYAEPLENAAAATGAADAAHSIIPGLLPGYTVPGLNTYLGTFISGLVGAGVVFAAMVVIGRALE
jgi:cobalt/nickel transport protein